MDTEPEVTEDMVDTVDTAMEDTAMADTVDTATEATEVMEATVDTEDMEDTEDMVVTEIMAAMEGTVDTEVTAIKDTEAMLDMEVMEVIMEVIMEDTVATQIRSSTLVGISEQLKSLPCRSGPMELEASDGLISTKPLGKIHLKWTYTNMGMIMLKALVT